MTAAPGTLLLAGLGLHALAFLPLASWLSPRLTSADEGPRMLIALAVLGWLFLRAPAGAARDLRGAALLTGLYALVTPFATPLPRAALAALALLACLRALSGRALHPASFGVALLALPVLPSLQFLLGYPARVAAAALAAPALRITGLPVFREGTCLRWGERLVAVDPPCSGVRMLWTAALVALALAADRGLGLRRSLSLLAGAGGAVLAVNLLRTLALFPVEAGMLSAPGWYHQGVGLVLFAALVLGLSASADRLARDER